MEARLKPFKNQLGHTGIAAVPGAAQVSLSWNASAGADSYVVKRSTTSDVPCETVISNVVSTSYDDTNVSSGTTYFHAVSAVKAAVESVNSTEANATPAPITAAALYAVEGNAQNTRGSGKSSTATALSYIADKVGSQAAQFNGTSSFVSIPRSIEDDFTVVIWVKTTDTAGSAGTDWWNGKGRLTGERLQVDPNNGNVLYSGFRWTGLFKSVDAGNTWTRLSALNVTTTPNENGVHRSVG